MQPTKQQPRIREGNSDEYVNGFARGLAIRLRHMSERDYEFLLLPEGLFIRYENTQDWQPLTKDFEHTKRFIQAASHQSYWQTASIRVRHSMDPFENAVRRAANVHPSS